MKALDEKVCCPTSDATEGGSGSACPPAAESVLHLEGVEARNEALAKLAKALAHVNQQAAKGIRPSSPFHTQ